MIGRTNRAEVFMAEVKVVFEVICFGSISLIVESTGDDSVLDAVVLS
jgi:hypothetical protein